jgi:hypothetical protein
MQNSDNDTYGISVEPGQDAALMVAIALCIDEIVGIAATEPPFFGVLCFVHRCSNFPQLLTLVH